jgi:predicted peroxiredoxin
MKSKYNVNGNQKLDQLFYMIDNSFVLSEEFKAKLRIPAFWIFSYADKDSKDLNEMIKQVIEDLRYCLIFSDKFITELENLYTDSLEFELKRYENK